MKIQRLRLLVWLGLWLVASPVWGDAVWLDVRSDTEYQQDHIAGDPRVDHTAVVSEVPSLIADKTTPIYLYCRSGRRAGIAKQALEEIGYTDVVNVGGIEDARRQRGLK